MKIEITNNRLKIENASQEAVLRMLERIGEQAEGYAVDLCPADTGDLRGSITHVVVEDEKAVYIGSDKKYAPYVELGTGQYYPGGRKEPWVYQDANGNWHTTHGQKAQPYIKPAITDHVKTYENIVKDEMKG